MTEIVLYVGVKEKKWNNIIHGLEKRRYSRVEFVLAFLTELKNGIWKDLRDIWTQPNMTDEMWYNYKFIFDKPELVEQKQLFTGGKMLKERLNLYSVELKARTKDEREGKVQCGTEEAPIEAGTGSDTESEDN